MIRPRHVQMLVWIAAVALCAAWSVDITAAEPIAAEPAVDFLRDVKPILAQRCYRCHSSLEEESNFRLDSVSALIKGGDLGPAVVPGKSGESRLIEAVLGTGDLKMPPEGEPLTAAQIATLRAWIDAGAKPPADDSAQKIEHWSYQKPVRPAVPKAADPAWNASPIDALVAAKHAELGLQPVGEAPPNLLLRRVYLDLTGLPPTPEELAAFLADPSPAAYEKIVDKLLDSPQYGERWARHWMDVWRYSDWDGYGNEVRESKPHIWRWRDWIVESLHADKPYDRMVQEMLAADELAPDDPESLRATGYLVRSWYKFNRNKWLDDAVEHTGKAFLGATFNCARCHDHMYDPVSHEEYYRLRAIFEPYDVRTDRVPGEANADKDGLVRVFDAKADAPTFVFVRGNEKEPLKDNPLAPGVPQVLSAVPFAVESVPLAPAAYYQGLAPFVREELQAAAKAAIDKAQSEVAAAETSLTAAKAKQAEFVAKQAAPENAPAAETKPAAEVVLSDDFARENAAAWTRDVGVWEYREGRLVQTDPRDEICGLTTNAAHPRDFAATFRFKTTGGDTYKSVGIAFDATGTKDFQAVYLSAHSPGPHLLTRRSGKDSYPASSPKQSAVEVGREVELKLAVRDKLANVWVDGKLVLAYNLPAERTAEGRLILWTYDATAEFLHVTVERIGGEFPLAPSGGETPPVATADVLAAAVEDAERGLVIAQKTAQAAEMALHLLLAKIAADEANFSQPPRDGAKELSLAAGAAERVHAAQAAEVALLQAQLKAAQARRAVKPEDKKLEQAAADAEKKAADAQTAYDAAQKALAEPTESYTRLTSVHPAASTGRRSALARWITSPENPLPARVAVNHIWLRHFGSPLVPTVFDFGLNGKPPTNPPLLDWLAVELMENGWRMKPIHKQIVLSRTYRLASSGGGRGQEAGDASEVQGPRSNVQGQNSPALAASTSASPASSRPSPLAPHPSAIDPENQHYWRANPRRLEAEAVRDATLAVAGSLDLARGGPELDQNAGLTVPRRSLYFRASKEKKMQFLSLFDSANPVECYRRSESIAPQQALAMANSTLTLAQARVLAKKLSDSLGIVTAEEAPQRFVDKAFVQILCREPTAAERATCLEFLTEQAARLADVKSLTAFAAGPEASVPPSTDPAQRARENLIHVLLNHNDFVTVR